MAGQSKKGKRGIEKQQKKGHPKQGRIGGGIGRIGDPKIIEKPDVGKPLSILDTLKPPPPPARK